MKKKRNGMMPIIMLLGFILLNGCAIGNKLNYSRTSTIGKELIDLQEAKEKGLLTEKEYQELKKEIMDGGPVQWKE